MAEDGRLGLILSGGGAFGAFEVGVIAELRDRGITPAVVSGTSAGALNGAAVAADVPTEELIRAWREASLLDVGWPRFDVWNLIRLQGLLSAGGPVEKLLATIGWSWLLDTRAQRRPVRRALGGREEFVAAVDLAITTVDIADGSVHRFVNRRPPWANPDDRYDVVDAFRIEHLLASSAVPLLFRPVPIDGREYWDGGLVANTPLAPAIHFGATDLLVVKAVEVARPADSRNSLGEAAVVMLDTLLDQAVRTDLKLAAARNRIRGFRRVRWKVIEPRPATLSADVGLDFNASTDQLIASGREITAEVLDEHAWQS